MTEHQKETAFLRHLILFDHTDEGGQLEKSIAEVQRDECCVKRAAWLMGLLISLSAAGLAYGAVLVEDLPYGNSRLLLKPIIVLGLASLISLVTFAGLLMAYRRKSNLLREQCRGLIKKLLERQLGKPRLATFLGSGTGAFAPVQFTAGVGGAHQPSANLPNQV